MIPIDPSTEIFKNLKLFGVEKSTARPVKPRRGFGRVYSIDSIAPPIVESGMIVWAALDRSPY
jgi:hypothetical protein